MLLLTFGLYTHKCILCSSHCWRCCVCVCLRLSRCVVLIIDNITRSTCPTALTLWLLNTTIFNSLIWGPWTHHNCSRNTADIKHSYEYHQYIHHWTLHTAPLTLFCTKYVLSKTVKCKKTQKGWLQEKQKHNNLQEKGPTVTGNKTMQEANILVSIATVAITTIIKSGHQQVIREQQ